MTARGYPVGGARRLVVYGRRPFPVDRLRLDLCLPATEDDSAVIMRTIADPTEEHFEVVLDCYGLPDLAAWHAAGWGGNRAKSDDSLWNTATYQIEHTKPDGSVEYMHGVPAPAVAALSLGLGLAAALHDQPKIRDIVELRPVVEESLGTPSGAFVPKAITEIPLGPVDLDPPAPPESGFAAGTGSTSITLETAANIVRSLDRIATALETLLSRLEVTHAGG